MDHAHGQPRRGTCTVRCACEQCATTSGQAGQPASASSMDYTTCMGWVDCRCFLSFVFLGVARRLELSPCNTTCMLHTPLPRTLPGAEQKHLMEKNTWKTLGPPWAMGELWQGLITAPARWQHCDELLGWLASFITGSDSSHSRALCWLQWLAHVYAVLHLYQTKDCRSVRTDSPVRQQRPD